MASMAIRRAVVYNAPAVHAFISGIICRHCSLDSKPLDCRKVTINKVQNCKSKIQI